MTRARTMAACVASSLAEESYRVPRHRSSADLTIARFARHPQDWYVEPIWVHDALHRHVQFGYDVIWDPACGQGTVLDIFSRDYLIHGTDIADRTDHLDETWPVEILDFVNDIEGGLSTKCELLDLHAAAGGGISIICNPPYSVVKGISEAFVRRALQLATGKVAMLFPLKWLASQARYKLFAEYTPEVILIFSERPSMPPGDEIEALGDRAFKGGMIDYCWIVWDVAAPTAFGETRTVWIAPRASEARG